MSLVGSAIDKSQDLDCTADKCAASATQSLSSAGAVAVARTATAFEAIRGEWAKLETEVRGASLFQSAAWAEAVFALEAARLNAGFDPVIVSLRKDGKLIGLLPLERVRTKLRTVLMPLGNSFPQYCDALLLPGVPPRPAIAAMVTAALSHARADVVLFLKVRADSALQAGMPKNHVVTASSEAAPFVDLTPWADFEAYFSSIKSKTRKNMRNARNRLEREAPLTHRIAATPIEVASVIRRTLEGRADRLKDQGLTSRAFGSGEFARFCETLPGQNGLHILAMSLRHGDKPIAEQWGFVHRGRYYAYVATRDFSLGEESPGKLHLAEVIETCFAKGLEAADFLVPVMPYKMTWANGAMKVTDYALPATIKGWAVILFWDRLLRPTVKRLVLGLDPRMRARLMALVSRK